MFLLIGDESDPCIAQVGARLRAQSKSVVVTTRPLSDEAVFSWRLTTDRSESQIHFHSNKKVICDNDWGGVLVRSFGAAPGVEGWQAKDLAYVQTETQSALIAWLRSLTCPVINPPLAENWFRPQRALPEQQALFARAGLPGLSALLTNDFTGARKFARRWDGAATYTPLSSSLRYPINDESQWKELERVMAQIPVCLVEPLPEAAGHVTYAGGQAVWNEGIELDGKSRDLLVEGFRRLARLTQLELFQVELLVRDGEACCVSFSGFVHFALHGVAEQEQVSDQIAALLRGEREGRQ